MKTKGNPIHLWLLCAAMLPAIAQAQFTYVTNNNAVTITGYTGPGGDVVIPQTINGLPVTRIGDNAFNGKSSLTGVTIPNSVTYIGYSAFQNCTGLKNLVIPDSVVTIAHRSGYNAYEYGAFQGCTGLTNVVIGNGVTRVANSAFNGCINLKSVTFGCGITSIGQYAFYNCGLTSLTIPDCVTGPIETRAFEGCDALTNAVIGNGVTALWQYAFYGCSQLKSLSLGNSITYIGYSAFQNCTGLKNLVIPDSVVTIAHRSGYNAYEYGAFQGCTGLTNVVIGNGVTSIGNSAFNGCINLRSVTIGNSVTTIGQYAFYGCGLTSVTIPDSVFCIGSSAFQNCTGLRGIYFRGSAPSLGSNVFAGCTNATVYYLPWTASWGTTYGGRPTAVWVASLVVSPSAPPPFGSVLVGTTRDISFTVLNAGPAFISGTAAISGGPFSVVSGGSYGLAPGQSITTIIRFAPTSAGNFAATATFTGDNGATVKLAGIGVTNATPTTGTIAGRVTRVSDGSPVGKVTVSVTSPSGVPYPQSLSGSDGRYSVSGIPAGTQYSVHAIPPDGVLLGTITISNVSVVAGQTTTVNVALPSTTAPPVAMPENTPVVLVRGFDIIVRSWADDDSNSWHVIRSALSASGFSNVWDCNQPEEGILGGQGYVINGTFAIAYNADMLKAYLKAKSEKYKNARGYYPPKIHVVAHSMGGLIVRRALGEQKEFILGGSTPPLKVGKVIMLATPHCGSPVADYAKKFFELLRQNWVDCGAMRDLTTASMRAYNVNSRWPSLPLYIAWASNAGYGLPWNGKMNICPHGKPLIELWNIRHFVAKTEEDWHDGAVTKPSANGVYWTRDHWWTTPYPVISIALNPVQVVCDSDMGMPVDHFWILHHSGVTDWIVKTLLNPAPVPTTLSPSGSPRPQSNGPMGGEEGGQPAIPIQVFELVDRTVMNGSVVSTQVVCDANTTLSFQLLAGDTNIVFRLTDPAGRVINSATPQTDTNVHYTATVLASNLWQATFTVANPTGGVWNAIIDTSSMTTTQAAYNLIVFGDSFVGLAPQTAELFSLGQDAVLLCGLVDASTNPVVAVSNATITAMVQLPNGTTHSLTMFDDGWHNEGAPNDGVYGAVLASVQQAGTYSIAYRATGTNALGRAFQRVATGTFSVSSGRCSILGDPVFEDSVDTDGDGYADYLLVKVWVNPTVAGSYILSGQLVDATELRRFAKSAQFSAESTAANAGHADIRSLRNSGDRRPWHISHRKPATLRGGQHWHRLA